jgi:hypothetical protein
VSTSPAYQEIVALVERRQWQEAIERARRLGSQAIAREWYGLARHAGRILERLKDHRSHAYLVSTSIRQLEASSCPLPEWDGSNLMDRTLLVVCRNNHVAPSTLRFGRLLALAGPRAKRCIALVEPRLVPLFRRSFPGIDVREAGPADADAYAQADVVASYETVLSHIGINDDGDVAALPSLVPDPDRVAALREKYKRSNPLIGISWFSTNEGKDVPSLEQWAPFLSRLSATYVSLQYGDVKAQVDRLQAMSGREIIYDDDVDAWNELDLFAAQTASVDAVVTISNTAANTAGALGVPMFVLLDDRDHLFWPFEGKTTSWYRSATLYHKTRRAWPGVFAELSADLERVPLFEKRKTGGRRS